MVDAAAQELGYAELKPSQQRAIKVFVEGHDVFVCLPTGSDKSLCYGVLSLAAQPLRIQTTSHLRGRVWYHLVWRCRPFARRKGLVTLQYPSLFWRNAINLPQQVWQQLEVL